MPEPRTPPFSQTTLVVGGAIVVAVMIGLLYGQMPASRSEDEALRERAADAPAYLDCERFLEACREAAKDMRMARAIPVEALSDREVAAERARAQRFNLMLEDLASRLSPACRARCTEITEAARR